MSGTLLDPPTGIAFPDFLKSWSDTHVAQWLSDLKCNPHADTFKEHDIRGDILLELDHDTLKEMGISTVGDRLRIINAVKALRLKCAIRTASSSAVSLSHVSSRFHPNNDPLNSQKPNDVQASHSRDSSRDSNARDHSPSSRGPKRLENNRPAPLVLPPNSTRSDLPRLIREPHSADSARAPPPIRPLPQPTNGLSPASTTSNGTPSSTRPFLPPLPPAPRGQPPQPPTARTAARNLHPLSGPRSRTPSQTDATPYTNSPLPPAPAAHSQNLLTPLSGNSSNNWPTYGLPPDPRSGPSSTLKPTIRSPSPFGSHSSSRTANGAAHGRNISFGGLSSPMGSDFGAKLPPRPSTSGTTQHPYASALPPLAAAALSPIIETLQSPLTNPSSPAFTVGRGPFHPSSHNQQLSLDDLRRKLVKFMLPDEGRSCVVDVADCAGGIEVMEKVLRKFDRLATRRKDDATNIMNRIETDDGGLSVDGWCVYLENDDQPDNGSVDSLLHHWR